jgi:hypothetical protein
MCIAMRFNWPLKPNISLHLLNHHILIYSIHNEAEIARLHWSQLNPTSGIAKDLNLD